MTDTMRYDQHVFVCTNQRVNSERPSCGESNGMELVAAFKKGLKDRGLNVHMRAQRTGCMDLCESGPMVVVYPEGVFYGRVQLSDVEEIIDSHLVAGTPVERLRLRFQRSQ